MPIKHVAIVGAGILGLSCAYYLNQQGFEVSLLDLGDLSDNCSQGNAGMIVPSHVIPLASPGNLWHGLKWGWNGSSPFAVHLSKDPEFWRWCALFVLHANTRHVKACMPVLHQLSQYSQRLLQDWQHHLPLPTGYRASGLLMLYQTEAAEREERSTAAMARSVGLEVDILGSEDLRMLEPDIRLQARGALHFPGDALVDPQALYRSMLRAVQTLGVAVHSCFEVDRIAADGHQALLLGPMHEALRADAVVLAAGSQTGHLARSLGYRLPMLPGKGYSFVHPSLQGLPGIPCLLQEGRVSVSPYPFGVRFGGTMEIGAWDAKIRFKRIAGMLACIRRYFPDAHVQAPLPTQIWQGQRPCTPDGMPYVGRLSGPLPVGVAAGHGMMGVSLAAASGKLLAQVMCGQSPDVDLRALDPMRFC